MDPDFECIRALDPLLAAGECLFGLEPQAHYQIHGKEKIISNALMATAPPARVLPCSDRRSGQFRTGTTDRNNLIPETTGPFMLECVYDRFRRGVTLLPSRLLYPLSIFEIEDLAAHGWSEATRQKVEEDYAVHYHVGTWWRGWSTFSATIKTEP